MRNLLVNRYCSITVLLLSITYLIYIFLNVNIRSYDDDKVFLSAFHENNIIDYVLNRYNTWSGRFSIELFMIYTIGYGMVWKLGIPICVALTAYATSVIGCKRFDVSMFGIALLIFAIIPSQILQDGAWWVTGFYNYLFPISLMLYSVSVLLKDGANIAEKFAVLVSIFLFCYNEQSAICFMLISATLIFLNKRTRTFTATCFTLSIINSYFLFSAPGNFRRSVEESWYWLPEFNGYGIFQKLTLGFDKLHQLLIFNCNLVFFILCLVVCAKFIFNRLKPTYHGWISCFLIISFLISQAIRFFNPEAIPPNFLSQDDLNPDKWSSLTTFFSYLYIGLVIVSVFTLLLEFARRERGFLTSTALLLLGFISVGVMGFSPTVYASGLRVDLLFEVVAIIPICNTLFYFFDR